MLVGRRRFKLRSLGLRGRTSSSKFTTHIEIHCCGRRIPSDVEGRNQTFPSYTVLSTMYFNMVRPRGIEPLSSVLQTAAMTTSAKDANWCFYQESNLGFARTKGVYYHCTIKAKTHYLSHCTPCVMAIFNLQNLVPRDGIEPPTFSV